MTGTEQPRQPRRGWLKTALRRAARRLGYIHHELVLANEALFRPASPRDRAASHAEAPTPAGTRSGDRSRAA